MNRSKHLYKISVFALLLLSLSLLSCSGPLKQSSISAHELYKTSDVIEFNNNSIGFFTTSVPRSNGFSEYKTAVSDIIESVFRVERADLSVIQSRDIINRINSSELTHEYADMLQGYELTGILDKKVLKKIGDILGVRYIARPKLTTYVERTSTRLSAFGLALISTRETSVNISLELWDVETGNIVWEASGQATIAVEAMRVKPVSFQDVAEHASRSLVKKFPAPAVIASP